MGRETVRRTESWINHATNVRVFLVEPRAFFGDYPRLKTMCFNTAFSCGETGDVPIPVKHH